jgi:hypothetical protein
MMEAVSSEKSVNIYQTTWRNIPKESDLHTDSCYSPPQHTFLKFGKLMVEHKKSKEIFQYSPSPPPSQQIFQSQNKSFSWHVHTPSEHLLKSYMLERWQAKHNGNVHTVVFWVVAPWQDYRVQ